MRPQAKKTVLMILVLIVVGIVSSAIWRVLGVTNDTLSALLNALVIGVAVFVFLRLYPITQNEKDDTT